MSHTWEECESEASVGYDSPSSALMRSPAKGAESLSPSTIYRHARGKRRRSLQSLGEWRGICRDRHHRPGCSSWSIPQESILQKALSLEGPCHGWVSLSRRCRVGLAFGLAVGLTPFPLEYALSTGHSDDTAPGNRVTRHIASQVIRCCMILKGCTSPLISLPWPAGSQLPWLTAEPKAWR